MHPDSIEMLGTDSWLANWWTTTGVYGIVWNDKLPLRSNLQTVNKYLSSNVYFINKQFIKEELRQVFNPLTYQYTVRR